MRGVVEVIHILVMPVPRVEYDKYLQPVAWWVLYESDSAAIDAVRFLHQARLVSRVRVVMLLGRSQFFLHTSSQWLNSQLRRNRSKLPKPFIGGLVLLSIATSCPLNNYGGMLS